MLFFTRKGIKIYNNTAIGLNVISLPCTNTIMVPLCVDPDTEQKLIINKGDFTPKYGKLTSPVNDGCPVYSPCSGTFEDIKVIRIAGVGKVPCAVIHPNGIDSKDKPFTSIIEPSAEDLIKTAKEFSVTDEITCCYLYKIIENIADSGRPIIICAVDRDHDSLSEAAVMKSFRKEIVSAAEWLSTAAGSNFRILINNSDASVHIKETDSTLKLVNVPACYPIMPSVFRYADKKGGIMIGAQACLALYRAIAHGRPHVSGFVTVAGDGVKSPANLEVPFGIKVAEILNKCEAFGTIQRVIAGGVMNGVIISPESPLTARITTLTAQSGETEPEISDCIGCGRCANSCHVNLAPVYFYKAKRGNNLDNAMIMDADRCTGCGCCSYVCPSGIPLTPMMKSIKKARVGEV